MVGGVAKNLYADSIVYTELRNSPFNIADINGISLQETIEWLAEAIHLAEKRVPIKMRLVLSLSRYNFEPQMAFSLLDAIRNANGREYVVGMDLSGDEDLQIPDNTSLIYKKAKDELGLGITIHAGETGNVNNIKWAISDCKADRIGHGLAAVISPKAEELIIAHDVCVEVCLTSNLLTGQIQKIEQHPVYKFIELEIPFVLCSDNPVVNGATLSDDYNLFLKTFGHEDIIQQMYEKQTQYSFVRE